MAALSLLLAFAGCAGQKDASDPLGISPSPGPGVFFVATNGNDGWSGSQPAPNARKTDGPFATLERALRAAREFKLQPAPNRPAARLFVRGGWFFLDRPLVLGPEDSGLLLAAYQNEHPVVSGGRRITGWTETAVEGRKLWVAEIPEVRDRKWFFRELWVNGNRAARARHPNRGYLAIAELPDKAADWTQGHTRFRFRAGDFKAWASVTNAEVLAMTRWVESRLPVVRVEEEERTISFGKRSVFELAPGDVYYAEGAFEFLDEPGEWYLNQPAGLLYYLPRPNETLSEMQAIAPVLAQVLRFEGRPESGQFIDRVAVGGLAFAHTEWCFPEGFHTGKNKPTVSPGPKPEIGGFAQAAIGVPGAVWGEGLRGAVFDRCRFANLGNYGLELARGCAQNRVSRCEFADLGAGGIKIGETQIRPSAAEQAGGNEISGCHIHDGGKMFASAIGIWLGQSPDNRLTHNLIHDFYYTGISIGWTWGYGPALATNNLVEFNHIHHIGVKADGDGPILSDMGGIYTLGRQPGTIIRNNLWHDVAGIRYGGWGIYFDEGSSGILAENNLVYRTTHGGFHQHYGETNLVRNNIFAFARDHQVQRSRPEPHPSFSFRTNIVYFNSGVLLGGNLAGDNYDMDWNLYFDARPGATEATFPLGPATLEKWRERGHDRLSLVADPFFVAPEAGDFRLRPNSPALKLGFRPFDLKRAGP